MPGMGRGWRKFLSNWLRRSDLSAGRRDPDDGLIAALKRCATPKQILCRGGRDFYAGVGVAPEEGKAGEPILLFDQLADTGKLFGWQDAGGCGEFGTGDFSAHAAWGELDLRVVADALALAQFAVGHEVEFVIVFGKPEGCVHGDTVFAEGCEADVTLAMDFCGNGCHGFIVNTAQAFAGAENL